MSSNFHIVMKNNKGTCVLMFAALRGIAQIPVGKAQNRAQNELKIHIVMKNNKGTCVLMYAVLHGIAHIPAGKAQNRAQNELKI